MPRRAPIAATEPSASSLSLNCECYQSSKGPSRTVVVTMAAPDTAAPRSESSSQVRSRSADSPRSRRHPDWRGGVTCLTAPCPDISKSSVSGAIFPRNTVAHPERLGQLSRNTATGLRGERTPSVTLDLGYFDDETSRLEPIDNPFGATVLPMRPE